MTLIETSLSLNLRTLARSRVVTRWHCVPTHCPQSIAEHQYMVAIIASNLAERIFGNQSTNKMHLSVLQSALFHDTAEIITGDIPSPFKQLLNQTSPESAALLKTLEQRTCNQARQYEEVISKTLIHGVVKAADLLEAISYLNQNGYTDYVTTVLSRLNMYLDKHVTKCQLDFPELDWSAVYEVKEELLNGKEQDLDVVFGGEF